MYMIDIYVKKLNVRREHLLFEGKFGEGPKWPYIYKFLPFHYTGLNYLVLTTQYE